MILGNKHYNRSPVPQSFIWVADYYDNTYLSEFDLNTKEPKSFYDINRNKLVQFGLIGEGSQVYFDVANGTFNINGHRITISYATENFEYPLTGRAVLYNDVITFKEAVSDADIFTRSSDGRFSHFISSFNVGYKKQMELEDVDINFQAILTVPLNAPSYMQIKICSNKDLDGELIIRLNGLISEKIHAPLKENMAGMINWEIK